MNVAIIGTDKSRFALAACLAEAGHHVTCVEQGAAWALAVANDLELAELLRRNVWEHRLSFASSVAEAMVGTEVVFVAGTPAFSAGGASVDGTVAIAHEIARHAARETVLVLRSTAPVGTAEKVAGAVREANGALVHVVSNPDLVLDRAPLDGFLCPDRVVVGVESERARTVMERLYAPFLRPRSRLIFTDPRTAELTASAAGAMLTTRDAVLRELAAACERLGADFDQVRRALPVG